ncbi:phospholipase effector Tle1 domain-containing protein [Moritella sp. 5]
MFSRGAYTARSLAGMIYCCGLLNKDLNGYREFGNIHK